MNKCPKDSIIDFDDKKCMQSCKENQTEFNNICYNRSPNDNKEEYIYVKNISDFENYLKSLLLLEPLPMEGYSIIIEKDDEIIYEITNSKNEENLIKNINQLQNKSIIDFGECEFILRKVYHINENDSLIIIKSEYKSDKASDKNIKYSIYEPYNRTQLNLSLCYNYPINLLIPLELDEETKNLYEQINEEGYNMFNQNDPFYQDVCTTFDSPNGNDILISDRFNYILNNNNLKCQTNCKYSFYSLESHYLKCTCSDNNKEHYVKKEIFTPKNTLESFYEVLINSNYDIIKCIDIIIDVKIITKNIGSIFTIICFIGYSVCLFFYIIKRISPLKDKLKKELKKNKTHFIFNISNLLYPPIRKSLLQKLSHRTQNEKQNKIGNKRKINSSKGSKFDDNVIIYSNM